MSKIDNPFQRGYQNPRIVRTLLITYENDCPPVWRPLHSSQAHLPDNQVARFPCLIGEDFALITENQEVPEELETHCRIEGIVRAVIYAITADDVNGKPTHVCDTYSEESAREFVWQLTFETGRYSRCWEISTAHITDEAMQYLEDLAITTTPLGLLFVVFRISTSDNCVGIKLIATPWTDENLLAVDNCTAEQLHHQQHSAGIPISLLTVLHLAGQADVRFLVFDPDAPLLEGLPLFVFTE